MFLHWIHNMKYFLYVACSLFSLSVTAKEIRMVQADKTFLGNITDKEAAEVYDNPEIEEKNKVETINAKVGDTINFINRDEVAHNVSGSLNQKIDFDVKLQEPGAANDRKINLTKAGEYTIQCAIHPKMKFKIKVD